MRDREGGTYRGTEIAGETEREGQRARESQGGTDRERGNDREGTAEGERQGEHAPHRFLQAALQLPHLSCP